MTNKIFLRDIIDDDLDILFRNQLDPEANHMAAFTSKDPTDRGAFNAHWKKILADATTINKTIIFDGEVVGSISSFYDDGRPEITYWLGREYWGKGLATMALQEFLANVNTTRPMYARVAKDNLQSRRVLEKCGFQMIEEGKGFANARGQEIDELLLELK